MLCTGNNNNQDPDSEPVNRKINLKHPCWVQLRSPELDVDTEAVSTHGLPAQSVL